LKNLKSTLLYLIVAALIGGYIYFFEKGPIKPKTEDEKKVKVLEKFVADDIQQIQVEDFSNTANAKMGPILLKKGDKETWTIDSPKRYRADDATIRSLLTGIGDFNPDTTIENPASLKDFGLDPPQGKCTLKSKAGETFVLLVGNKGMGGSTVYIKPGDKNKVYLVGSFAADSLHKDINSYRDRFFFKTDSVLAQKIRVQHGGKVYAFEKDKGSQWNITEPLHSKADTNKVRDLLNSISSLRIEEFVTDHPSGLSSYGLSSPRDRVDVVNNDSSHTILIGKKKDKTTNLYAKSGEEPYLDLVGEYIDKTLDLKIDDYRDKSALQFDGGAVKSLTVHRGATAYIYQKDAKGQWACPGRSAANDEATNLINQLASMAVLEFPASKEPNGLKDPVFQVEVSLVDGSVQAYHFGRRDQGKVYVSTDRSKDVYKISDAVVAQMEGYYNSILTPVAKPQTPVAPK
jgi:hypothetical protein